VGGLAPPVRVRRSSSSSSSSAIGLASAPAALASCSATGGSDGRTEAGCSRCAGLAGCGCCPAVRPCMTTDSDQSVGHTKSGDHMVSPLFVHLLLPPPSPSNPLHSTPPLRPTAEGSEAGQRRSADSRTVHDGRNNRSLCVSPHAAAACSSARIPARRTAPWRGRTRTDRAPTDPPGGQGTVLPDRASTDRHALGCNAWYTHPSSAAPRALLRSALPRRTSQSDEQATRCLGTRKRAVTERERRGTKRSRGPTKLALARVVVACAQYTVVAERGDGSSEEAAKKKREAKKISV
jgi:hypothetical protein